MKPWLPFTKFPAPGMIVLLAALSGLVWLTLPGKEDAIYTPPSDRINRAFSYITDLNYKIYGQEGVKSLLEADSYSIVPRRIMVFNLNSFNEVQINNARIKHYLDGDSAEKLEIVPLVIMPVSFGGHQSGNKRGMPTRGVINGIILEVFRAGSPVLSLYAEGAMIDKNLKTSFYNSILESKVTGKRITSKKIIWNKNDTMFSIPGKYYAKTPKGQATGKGIKVGLDFVVSLL